MFRHSVRRFATTAARRAVAPAAAHEPSPYTIAISKAQGIAKGLTGGMLYIFQHSIFLCFLNTEKKPTI
jgi:cysteine synthase A